MSSSSASSRLTLGPIKDSLLEEGVTELEVGKVLFILFIRQCDNNSSSVLVKKPQSVSVLDGGYCLHG